MSAELLIPKILHQTWLGPDPLPEEDAGWVETWRAHHPDWEHHLWTDENLPSGLVRAEGYERIRNPVERSDIMRLELVHRFGGVYVDTDVECLRPIDPLLPGVRMFVERLNSGRLSHFVMGAVAGHELLARALAEIRPREFYGYDKFVSGPDYLASFIDDAAGVTIFDTDVFTPRTPAAHRTAYAFHHSAGAWKGVEEWQKDAKLAQRRLRRTQVELDELEQKHRETLERLEATRARLAASEAKVIGTSPRRRLAAGGQVLLAEARVVAVRAPHRLRKAARAVKRRLQAAFGG